MLSSDEHEKSLITLGSGSKQFAVPFESAI